MQRRIERDLVIVPDFSLFSTVLVELLSKVASVHNDFEQTFLVGCLKGKPRKSTKLWRLKAQESKEANGRTKKKNNAGPHNPRMIIAEFAGVPFGASLRAIRSAMKGIMEARLNFEAE